MDADTLLERKAIELEHLPEREAQARYDAFKKYAGLDQDSRHKPQPVDEKSS